MTDMVIVKGNDVFTDSMVIAEGTGIRHDSVQRRIRDYESELRVFGKVGFQIRASERGQEQKVYLLTEPQATFLITLMRNTQQVVRFKMELVKRFFDMRMIIIERQSIQWQQSRQKGKEIRREETDRIKELVEYAKAQGSRSAGKIYISYSRLANKAVGIQKRDLATGMQLSHLMVVEDIINKTIREGMRMNAQYKAIYQTCRQKIEAYTSLAMLEAVA